jgi:hypothetical protein
VREGGREGGGVRNCWVGSKKNGKLRASGEFLRG